MGNKQKERKLRNQIVKENRTWFLDSREDPWKEGENEWTPYEEETVF